jgi:coenzyme PQQ precursor peptide PqqA
VYRPANGRVDAGVVGDGVMGMHRRRRIDGDGRETRLRAPRLRGTARYGTATRTCAMAWRWRWRWRWRQHHENHEARFKNIPYGPAGASRMIGWTIDFRRPHISYGAWTMKWETPEAVDLRYGMEITMYISNR